MFHLFVTRSYAYIHVAMYGKSFCDAGKDTWNLIKSHGVDAIINDSLISTVLTIGCLLVGLICGAVGYLWVYAVYANNQWDQMFAYALLIAFGAFLIGIMMMSVVTMVIDSGASTTFVCVAEDPAALARTKPELYNKFREVYPQIQMHV